MKVALMGAWILGICTLGYVSGATSFAVWIVLAVLSLAPPAVGGAALERPRSEHV